MKSHSFSHWLVVTAFIITLGGCDTTNTPNETTADVADVGNTEEVTSTLPDTTSDTETGPDDTVETDSADDVVPSDDTVAPRAETMHHAFESQEIAAGEEISNVCYSWVLNNPEEIWVNRVDMMNLGGVHHSNWFFVPWDYQDWPTDPWPNCYGDGFHEIDAALSGGVLYAQSTQVTAESQAFAEGAAVRIPPWSRIIGGVHFLNYLPEPITTHAELTLKVLPVEEVTAKLTPFQLIYGDLHINPEAQSEFYAECDISATYEELFKEPLDMKIHYLLPHYHNLGNGFRTSILGGDRDGEVLLENGIYEVEPWGKVFDPPIDLAGANGLSFMCGFDNPTSEEVGWGIGDQEMCEALGFVESKMAFSAGVQSGSAEVGSDGDVILHSGNCNVQGFAFGQNKAGGTPPENATD
jgi:hypothetical protein